MLGMEIEWSCGAMGVIFLSELSWGNLGRRRREGGDRTVDGGCRDHIEHPENLSRAELFQELFPHQTTLQFLRLSPCVPPIDGNVGSQEVKSS